LRLSKAFDTTPEYWLNLQQEYDLWLTKSDIDLSKIMHFTAKEDEKGLRPK
jgi:antitoxin HigA-1